MHRTTSITLVTILAASAAASHAADLAVNGGFETGDFSGYVRFPTGPGQQAVVQTNPAAGTYAAQIINDVAFSNSLIKAANLGAGVVTPGQTIYISFDARGSFPIGGVMFAEFFSELAGGGVSKTEILGGAPLAVASDPEQWTRFEFTAVTGFNVSGGVTLQLGAVNGPFAGTTAYFDNIVVSTTPPVSFVEGDADGDGDVDFDDLGILLGNYDQSGFPANTRGDSDGDGDVDFDDLGLLLGNYGLGVPPGASEETPAAASVVAVPEAGALGLPAVMGIMLARRRQAARRAARRG